MLIQPKSRCFCVYHCECLCIHAYFDTKQHQGEIVSCHIIKSKNKIQAGFMDSFPDNIYYDDEQQQPTEAKLIFDPISLFFLLLFILLFVFLLGELKIFFFYDTIICMGIHFSQSSVYFQSILVVCFCVCEGDVNVYYSLFCI